MLPFFAVCNINDHRRGMREKTFLMKQSLQRQRKHINQLLLSCIVKRKNERLLNQKEKFHLIFM